MLNIPDNTNLITLCVGIWCKFDMVSDAYFGHWCYCVFISRFDVVKTIIGEEEVVDKEKFD